MAKLPLVAMELLNTLIKGGMPYDKAISFVTGIEDTKPATFNKVESKPQVATAKSSSKTVTHSKAESKPKAKANAFGKVKVGDYFKVVVDKDGKPTTTRIGKADKVDLKDKILTATNGKKFALEKCITVSKAEYGKLKKKLKVSEAKEPVSTATKLTAKDYKVVYCFNLTKLGKITDEEFAKAKTDDAVASELYKKFKGEVKLANSEAIKLLAEKSAKVQPQA